MVVVVVVVAAAAAAVVTVVAVVVVVEFGVQGSRLRGFWRVSHSGFSWKLWGLSFRTPVYFKINIVRSRNNYQY